MTSIEIQDHIHIYSMFSFTDGTKIPGILVNKYNITTTQIEYYFIAHDDIQTYKAAFEKYDRESCGRLSKQVMIEQIQNIRPVSLADYKIIMQLMDERQQLMNMYK
ncbi:MAG: hypothetical protein NT126_02025 [Bacteroidetes bacterium]|nr:hypothetical protein [Bacteroidota bacterium]